MKNLIFIFVSTFFVSFACSETETMNQMRAEHALKVSSLEYQDTTKAPLQLTTEEQAAGKSIKTSEVHTSKTGIKYTIYQGSKGGKFIIRRSAKTGNYYRQYLK